MLGLKFGAGAPIVRMLIRATIDCDVESFVDFMFASTAVAFLAFLLGVLIGV